MLASHTNQLVLGAVEPIMIVGIMLIAAVLTFLTLLFTLLKQYKRCPTNRVLVIYGKTNGGQAARTVHGGAAFVVPLLQDYAYLSLEPIRTTISSSSHGMGKQLGFEVPRVYTVAIGTTPDLLQNTAVRLLGLNVEQISQHTNDLIIDELSRLTDTVSNDVDRETFNSELQASLDAKLGNLGLQLISFR